MTSFRKQYRLSHDRPLTLSPGFLQTSAIDRARINPFTMSLMVRQVGVGRARFNPLINPVNSKPVLVEE